MELRHLRYLAAIADAGTFIRAAEHLHVAQPALTRQIHDLEEELDVELFDARARKATLTAAGHACVRLARHVIQDTERAVAQARLSNSGVAGRCVLAVGPLPLLSGFVPRFVARIRSRFAGITMVVVERMGHDQWDALTRAEVDIGLGVAPTSGFAALAAEVQLVVAMDHAMLATNHALANRETVSLDDLRDVPFLALDAAIPDMDAVKLALAQEMKRLGFPRTSVAPREFSSIESLIAHIQAGQGWTLAPPEMARHIKGIVPVPLTAFRAPLRVMRIWRRAENRPVLQTVFRELRRLQEEERNAGSAAAAEAVNTVDPTEEFVPARLDLRHLRSFLAVASLGTIGRAAEELEVTQPALSRQMRELEYDVGVSLLERGTRGVTLTVPGEMFCRDVKSVMSIVDSLPREVRRATRGTAQRCVIGTIPHPYVERLLTRALSDLEGRSSRVRVGLRSVPSPLQADALRAGEIDVAIGHVFPVPRALPARLALITTRLFHDRICCALLAEDHPLARAESLGVRDLADIPFLWVNREFFPRFHDAIFARFAAAGLTPPVEAEQDGLLTLWSLAGQGLGWTLGWASHLSDPPPRLRAVPLRDFDLPWGGEVTYRQDESRAPILAAIDAILAHANELFGAVKAPDGALPDTNTSQAVMS